MHITLVSISTLSLLILIVRKQPLGLIEGLFLPKDNPTKPVKVNH